MTCDLPRIEDVHQVATRIWNTLFYIHRLSWTITTDYLTGSPLPYPEPLSFASEPRLVTISDTRARLRKSIPEVNPEAPSIVKNSNLEADGPVNSMQSTDIPQSKINQFSHTAAEWEHCLQVNQPNLELIVENISSLDGLGWQVDENELGYFASTPVTLGDGGTRDSAHEAAFRSAKILQLTWPHLLGFGISPPELLTRSQLGWLATQRPPLIATPTTYPKELPSWCFLQVVCYCRCLFVRGWTPADGFLGVRLEQREAMGVADVVENQVYSHLRAERRVAEDRLRNEAAVGRQKEESDAWTILANLAQSKLSGKERMAVLAIANAKGKISLADLKIHCEWTSDDAWNSCRQRLNAKLKHDKWIIRRVSNEVIAKQIPLARK